ncbi:MerR family transcriptional regulator [Streptomyces sp. NPDC000070]|uniref:MerR family transcriptional regulator n=1 Tax=Streptomyces sp. NPDC000070 TaxID=3154240 RepID=UPI0033165577
MIDDGTGLLTIGELARTTGLTVRTIRYWSDEGALPPVARSAGGYRLYDAASVALDARIRSLRVTRAVLSTVAKRGCGAEETTLMNRLARLSAAERQQIVEDFMAEIFEGIDTADPDIRGRLRFAAAQLPDYPTPEQVDAWVELAELIQDPGFRAQMRRMVEFNAEDRGPGVPAGSSLWFMSRLVQLAAEARRRGIAPEAPEADDVLRELLGPADRSAVLERLTAASYARVARYRELQAIVNGLGPQPAYDEEFAWVVAALEIRTGS